MRRLHAIAFITAIIIINVGICFGLAADSLGAIGKTIQEKAADWAPLVMPVLPVVGAALFRVLQKILQRLPTKWRWVNNKFTVGLIGKIVCFLFGKTTLIYNARTDLDQRSQEELRDVALKHLGRQGGIMRAFDAGVR